MNSRLYRYVGPDGIKQRAKRESHCIQVTNVAALAEWIASFLPKGRTSGEIPATFVIDPEARLWIADRRSEHVACADGQDVLAAGEMFITREKARVQVVEITNQSTGYCPESSCWSVIVEVLTRLGIPHPSHFAHAIEFRRCDQCGATNIIKEAVFECAVCSASLSPDWNFEADE